MNFTYKNKKGEFVECDPEYPAKINEKRKNFHFNPESKTPDTNLFSDKKNQRK